jgi:alcohol dehydrogenase class IV
VRPTDSGSFSYANPRTIHWGSGTLPERLEQELFERRAEHAFVITTRSVESNPALGGKLRTLLGSRVAGDFASVAQHAPASAVAAATRAAAAAKPDVLISFGGVSPIDAAMAVAFSLG